jgi:methylenetetrahydrofolate dehydrogenase (NADP+)/methenyltetrahydrofolate cyclohydrolase
MPEVDTHRNASTPSGTAATTTGAAATSRGESGAQAVGAAGSARLLAGKPVAERVLADVSARADALRARGVTPSLATILVGDDDASAGYIRIKQRQAAELGFTSPHIHLPADATQADLLDAVRAFSDDKTVHGLLVQYPVPGHLDYEAALSQIDPDKDVDGLHPMNMGRLALGLPGPLPCTPAGIEELLAYYEIPVAGRNVVIVGRGPTLGRPLALLLSRKRPTANAAVTVVHTGVPDWAEYTRRADILVAAAGVPGIIQPEHVRPGSVVIGGGVRYAGRRLLPDVDESCAEVAGAITPRVGGVGPTTVAMLFRNAVAAAERATESI